VSIVSDRPQTTRTTIRGVRTTPTSQLVLLDTPGLHKPRTRLGERTNGQARATLSEVDAVCMLIQADAPIGPGDRFVAGIVHRAGVPGILVVNKIDLSSRAGLAAQLDRAALTLGDFAAYVPVSAATGENIDVLVRELEDRLPDGPQYFPDGVVSDAPETFVAAELVREQLLGMARDELAHSIAVTVEHDEERSRPGLLVLVGDIRVERDSQRGIVIGKGGAVIKEAGTAARRELEALLGVQVHLELRVRVDRDWQRRPAALDRLGF
jgi:GTP-binding protein Era